MKLYKLLQEFKKKGMPEHNVAEKTISEPLQEIKKKDVDEHNGAEKSMMEPSCTEASCPPRSLPESPRLSSGAHTRLRRKKGAASGCTGLRSISASSANE